MYISQVKSRKNGKEYCSYLIRESYRENGKVKTRTLLNISKLPQKHIAALQASFKNETNECSISDFGTESSREYGASFALKEFSKNIGLDKIISSTKNNWRENVIAMIIGRILYQGSKLSLANTFMDTALWELAGFEYGVKPSVENDCYKAMDELQKRKNRIENKLAKKHLQNGSIILYDITNTWLEGEYKDSEIVKYGKAKGGKKGYKQVALGLLTDENGCPVGVEIFKGNTSDQSTVLDQIKKISGKYGISNAVFVGDRGMLTQKRIEEVQKTDFKIITAMTHKEMRTLIDKESLQLDFFDELNITEVIDSDKPDMRYMLCKNENEMVKERKTRQALIDKVSTLLNKKSSVKSKRDPIKVAASVGRIFEKCRVEKFFNWAIGERGELEWNLKDDVIDKESELDGCYVIKTNANKEYLNKEQVVSCYQGLQKVEQAFKNMKTVSLDLRPIFHKTDARIESHIFIVMLAYYIQWHMMQKLKPLFNKDGLGKNKRWSFQTVIERLKSIRKYNKTINGIVVGEGVTTPDKEQRQILDLLEIQL